MLHPKIEEARKFLKISDHMVYITFPAMGENRLLIEVLEQISRAQRAIIAFILENEYDNKRIRLYMDPKANFNTFLECAPRYGLKSEHLEAIKQTAATMEMHSNSPMEFVRQDKFVILSEGTHLESLTYEKVKGYLIRSQEMLKSVESRIKS